MSKRESKNAVCFVIPAYNEASVIKTVISDLVKEAQAHKLDYQIVVIDDASSDDTAQVSTEAGATVITHLLNQGAGGATSTGLRYAAKYGFTVAATLDADGQHSASDVINCVLKAKELQTDLLIGSRLMNTEGMSRVKIVGNQGLSIATWLLFGVRVTDSQSGLRVFSKKALDVLEWKSTSYEFCSEMLWRAKQANLVIKECPIKAIYTDYSVSKGQNNWNGINIIKSLARRRIVEFFE